MPLFPRMPRRMPKPTEPLTGSGDLSVASDGRGGMVVRDGRPVGEWGRIASHVSGNEYTAIRLDDGDTAYPDRDTLTVRCWELNGRTDVAVDTLVRLEANRAGDGFTFVAAPASGVTVKEADGAPSYAGATVVEVDQDTGLKLATGGGGAPKVRVAQKVNAPVDRVLIGNTTFGPPVAFSADDLDDHPSDGDTVLLTGQTTASENGYYVFSSAAGGTLLAASEGSTPPVWTGAGAVVSCAGGTKVNTTWVHLGSGAWVCAAGHNYSVAAFGYIAYVPMYGTAAGEENALVPSPMQFDGSTLGTTNDFQLYSREMVFGQATANSKLRLYGNYVVCQFPSTGSGSWLDGVSSVLGPGAEATGGIITYAGSGSFVGTGTANSFTNTNSFSGTTTFTGTVASQSAATFTPANASTVPATIQGAASQIANLLEAKTNGGSVVASISAAGAITGASLNGPYDGGTW